MTFVEFYSATDAVNSAIAIHLNLKRKFYESNNLSDEC